MDSCFYNFDDLDGSLMDFYGSEFEVYNDEIDFLLEIEKYQKELEEDKKRQIISKMESMFNFIPNNQNWKYEELINVYLYLFSKQPIEITTCAINLVAFVIKNNTINIKNLQAIVLICKMIACQSYGLYSTMNMDYIYYFLEEKYSRKSLVLIAKTIIEIIPKDFMEEGSITNRVLIEISYDSLELNLICLIIFVLKLDPNYINYSEYDFISHALTITRYKRTKEVSDKNYFYFKNIYVPMLEYITEIDKIQFKDELIPIIDKLKGMFEYIESL